MKTVFKIIFLLILTTKLSAQLSATLTIENQEVIGTNFYFDIYLTRSSPAAEGDIYLGNADFALTFNSSNFSNASFSKEGSSPGLCTFSPTNNTSTNTLITQVNYFDNVLLDISGNNLILSLNGPTPSDQTTFNNRVAKITGANSTHRLGRFIISGISNPNGTAGLQWKTSNDATALYSLDHTEPFISSRIAMLNAINPSDAALPIELISFEVSAMENQKAQLTWQTASEVDNRGFVIERKTEAEQWTDIGFVEGHGTTHQLQSYSFTDQDPSGGTNYYRLAQTDFDGSIHYSNIESVFITRNSPFKIYPNPSSGILYVQGEIGKEFFIRNNQGVICKKGSVIQEAINISNLIPGIYFILIEEFPIKFIKW